MIKNNRKVKIINFIMFKKFFNSQEYIKYIKLLIKFNKNSFIINFFSYLNNNISLINKYKY